MVALDSLIENPGDALVIKLPRSPGRKDSEYMHLFGGPVDVEAHVEQARTAAVTDRPTGTDLGDLEQRVSELEATVAELIERLGR